MNGAFSILIDFKKKGTKTSDTTTWDNKQSLNGDILSVLTVSVTVFQQLFLRSYAFTHAML